MKFIRKHKPAFSMKHGKKKARKGAKTARMSGPVVAKINQIVNRRLETKYVSCTPENVIYHNSAIANGDQYRVLPYLIQDGSELGRIGDRVEPVSLTMKGQVSISPGSNTTRPLMVRILVLQLKNAHDWPTAQTNWAAGAFNSLLKYNFESAGTENQSFNGSSTDLYVPVNKDLFDVLGERFVKLNPHTSASAVEGAQINSLAKNFNMKIRTPAHLRYTNKGVQYPENFAPFISVGYSYMDGSQPDTVTQEIVVTAISHLYYKDA